MVKDNTKNSGLLGRYVWLVEVIGRNGKITFDTINKIWLESPLNPMKEPLPKKTFQNHCAKIKELFGVDILCDRKANYSYYLDNMKDLKRGDFRRWLFGSISVNNMMNEYPFLRDRVVFDRTPETGKCMVPLLESMKTSLMVRFEYRSYRDNDVHIFKVAPYCLKVFRFDWYLLGKVLPVGRLQIFSMDRISNLEITGPVFHLPVNFNGEKFFENYYGAMVTDVPKLQKVILKARDGHQEYLRVRPMHHSQREIEIHPDWSLFQYELCPAADFIEAILSQGNAVEVLEPQSLREQVVLNLKKSIEQIHGIGYCEFVGFFVLLRICVNVWAYLLSLSCRFSAGISTRRMCLLLRLPNADFWRRRIALKAATMTGTFRRFLLRRSFFLPDVSRHPEPRSVLRAGIPVLTARRS